MLMAGGGLPVTATGALEGGNALTGQYTRMAVMRACTFGRPKKKTGRGLSFFASAGENPRDSLLGASCLDVGLCFCLDCVGVELGVGFVGTGGDFH